MRTVLASCALFTVFAAGGVPAPLRAQTPPRPIPALPGNGTVDSATTRVSPEAQRLALRDLIRRQEQFYSDHDTYATSMSLLETAPTITTEPAPVLSIIAASNAGWSAMATDRAGSAKSCVIYVGAVWALPGGVPKTKSSGRTPTTEAVPVCDDP